MILKSAFARKKEGLAYFLSEQVPIGTLSVTYSIRFKALTSTKITDLFLCNGEYAQPNFTLNQISELKRNFNFAVNQFDETYADFIQALNYTVVKKQSYFIHNATASLGQFSGLGFSKIIKPGIDDKCSVSIRISNSIKNPIVLLNIRESASDGIVLKQEKLIPAFKDAQFTLYEANSIDIPLNAGHIRLYVQSLPGDDLILTQPFLSFTEISTYFPKTINNEKQNTNDLNSGFIMGTALPEFIDSGIIYEKQLLTENTVLHVVKNETEDNTIGVGNRTNRGIRESKAISASVKFLKETSPRQVVLSLWSSTGFISRINLIKKEEEDHYLYSVVDAVLPDNCTFCRMYVITGALNTVKFYEPFVSWSGGASNYIQPPTTHFPVNDIDISKIQYLSSESFSRITNPFALGSIDVIDGRIIDRNFDPLYFSCWGSSTIWDMHTQLDAFSKSIGCMKFYGGGGGGEVISHHSARMGARKARIKFSSNFIQSSGEVEVIHSLNMIRIASLRAFECSINGVRGTLKYNEAYQSKVGFMREAKGDEIYAPLIYEAEPTYDPKFRDGFCIINAAKNDTTFSNISSEILVTQTHEMYCHLRSAFKRCLVMGQFMDRHFADDSATRQSLIDMNQRLKDFYGHYYIDVQSYLMSDQIWIDTGITKTDLDIQHLIRGVIPYSLSDNDNHMNYAARQAVIDHLIKPRMVFLDWI